MKCTIDKGSLLRLASVAASVADAKSSMPILGMARLTTLASATGTRLQAEATDLYSSAQVTASCDVESPGEVCVNAKALRSLVASLPEGDVKLAAEDRKVTVRSGRFRRTLEALPADDFPPGVKAGEGGAAREVSSDDLKAVLSQVRSAMSTDESRPHLACVLIDGEGKAAVTTDGHRLHKAEGVDWGLTVQVPPKMVGLLLSLAGEGEAVRLWAGEGYLCADAGDVTYKCKLVDETFPPYGKVIPGARKEVVIRVAAADVLGACKRLSLVGDGMRLSGDEEGVLYLASSTVGDEAEESMPCECDASTTTVGINARYLAEAVSACGAETVEVAVAGELDPVVVRAEGFVGVIMPMRV